MDRRFIRSPARLARVIVGLIALAVCLPACQLAGFIAAGIQENTPVKVFAEYEGLEGKTFAVVIDADRAIQGRWPTLVPDLTARIDAEIAANTLASGHVPPSDVVMFQQTTPRWTIMSRAELASQLAGGEGAVDRIILIELFEFRLNEPGNRHLWDGVAAGTVAVLETDSAFPEEYAFNRPISVGFPDGSGYGPDEMSASLVATALVQRFAQRCAWLFFDHEEEYEIPF